MEVNLELVGKTKTHLELIENENKWIHTEAKPSYLALQATAEKSGFRVRLASSFRDFETQLKIWNEKASGKRKLFSKQEKEIDPKSLSKRDLVYAILAWSQLPGASRHHWGTDIDVFDEASCPLGYKVQLSKTEVEPGGVFFRLHEWLDNHALEHGFYRPYTEDKGGIQPEKWHLSFFPKAQEYFEAYDLDLLTATIETSEILLKETILQELPNIFSTYVTNITLP